MTNFSKFKNSVSKSYLQNMSLIIFPKKFGSISSCKKYKNSGYCQFLYGKKYLYEIYYEKWPFFKNLAGATSKRHF